MPYDKLLDVAKDDTLKKGMEAVKKTVKTYFIKPKGADDYIFMDIIGEQKMKLESDVSDHFVESNVAYQDQISLKPMYFTVSGEVGELVYYQTDKVQTNVGYVAQKLTNVASFLPSVSKTFNQARDKVLKALQWVDTADNLYTRLSHLNPDANKQQKAYLYLLSWWQQRTPIDVVESPWNTLQNYVITNVEFTQPKDTVDKSYITITFKEFRTTDLKVTKFDAKKYQGRAGFQKAPNVEQGQTTGRKSTLAYISGKIQK